MPAAPRSASAAGSAIGNRAAAGVELGRRVDAHGPQVGVEQVAVIDLAIDHFGAVVVGLADHGARLDAAAAQRDDQAVPQ